MNVVRNILAVFGVLFLLLMMILGIGLLIWVPNNVRLKNEAVSFSHEVVPEILKNDAEVLKKYVSPNFFENDPDGTKREQAYTLYRQLGGFVSMGEPQGNVGFKTTPFLVYANFQIPVECEEGKGMMSLTLVRVEEVWKVNNVQIVSEKFARMQSMEFRLHELIVKQDFPDEEQKLWALATGGIITHINGQRHDLLGNREKTEESRLDAKKSLRKQWGIRSRYDLMLALGRLWEGSAKQEFNEWGAFMVTKSVEERRELKRDENNPEYSGRAKIIADYYTKFGRKSISGFDYSRFVSLCGWGYTAGYLTNLEAWRLMMPAARRIQATFDSWEDFGWNYVIGREFTLYEMSLKDGEKRREAYRVLCEDPKSPWRTIPWNLDLMRKKDDKD